MECSNGHPAAVGDAHCGTCGAAITAGPRLEAEALSCSGGHLNEADAVFCGTCGERLDGPPAADKIATALSPPACPKGHGNPDGNLFCGTCGAKVETPAQAAAPSSSCWRTGRVVAFAGVLLVAVVLAIAAAASGSGSDDNISDAELVEETTPDEVPVTTSVVEVCWNELGEWLPFVTGRGGGDLMGAAAEFGIQSPEYLVLQDAWSIFNQHLYVEGNDEASNRAYRSIGEGCTRLGSSYRPGHLPPA